MRRRRLERIEVKLPHRLAEEIDVTVQRLGFTGRSEFIRFLIHSFLLDLNRSGQNTANLRNNCYKHSRVNRFREGK